MVARCVVGGFSNLKLRKKNSHNSLLQYDYFDQRNAVMDSVFIEHSKEMAAKTEYFGMKCAFLRR